MAGGTFTTVDTPDGSGFYLITGIAGVRNDAVILGLQPTGTPIPGNEHFSVDNLVRLESPQLTVHGFGYAIAGGTFSNPFFADFQQPPEYLEFFSAPPLTPGVKGPEDSELPIRFSATLAPVPQTATWALLLAGLGMLGLTRRCRRHYLRAVSSYPPVVERRGPCRSFPTWLTRGQGTPAPTPEAGYLNGGMRSLLRYKSRGFRSSLLSSRPGRVHGATAEDADVER
jgi:hypothetical protein